MANFMMKLFVRAVFLGYMCTKFHGSACKEGLVPITNCTCPEFEFVFECTVSNGLYTVWRGSVLQELCQLNEVTLRHADIVNESAVCGEGVVVAQGISVTENDCFTSRLTLLVTRSLNETNIDCGQDNGSDEIIVGSHMLLITEEPEASPNVVNLGNITQNLLVFNWTSPLPTCPALIFNIISENCGNCPNSTPDTTVSCTNFTLSKTCKFFVQSVTCRNLSSNTTSSPVAINLQVPDKPLVIRCTPHYLKSRTGETLARIKTSFERLVNINISKGIDGSATFYTISYSDASSGQICNSTTISSSSCDNGECEHLFEILDFSSCRINANINVTIFGTNILGNGDMSNPITIESSNQVVDVKYDQSRRSIICDFINPSIDEIKECTASVTYGDNCQQQLGIFSDLDASASLVIPINFNGLKYIPSSIYCFVVTANASDAALVVVEGDFTDFSTKNMESTPDVHYLVILIITLIIVVAVVIVCLTLIAIRYCVMKRLVKISFSIKNKPGSLVAVLKALEELNIDKYVDINTQLISNEDTNDKAGYKTIYVHCLCSKSQKQQLDSHFKKNLEIFNWIDEFQGEQDEEDISKYPVTLVLTVKKNIRSLRMKLEIFEREGINIDLNTRSDRRSSTHDGYNINHMECSCSRKTQKQIVKRLRRIGAVDVHHVVQGPKKVKKTRAIGLYVKDSIGSLVEIMKIFSNNEIYITDINPDHIQNDTNAKEGFQDYYVEFSCNPTIKSALQDYIKEKKLAKWEELPGKSEHNDVVKLTVTNERGSTVKVLDAFANNRVNIIGINHLDPVFDLDFEVIHKCVCIDFISTSNQETKLRELLLDTDCVFDISPTDQNAQRISGSNKRRIQFSLKYETGSLLRAVQVFDDVNIYILGINRINNHTTRFVYVECKCVPDKRQELIGKLRTSRVKTARFLPEDEVPADKLREISDFGVVYITIEKDVSLTPALRVFDELDVHVIVINPDCAEYQCEYLECECNEEKRTSLLRTLKATRTINCVGVVPKDESSNLVPDSRCTIKLSLRGEMKATTTALSAFSETHDVNIINFNNTNIDKKDDYKHIHVKFVSTDDQEEKIMDEIRTHPLAYHVKRYELKKQKNSTIVELSTQL